MAPRPSAKPPPVPASVKAFEAGYQPALTSEAGHRRLVGVIGKIASPAEISACLDAYCRRYDPARPPSGRGPATYARVIGYLLFGKAADLLGPLNALRTQLAAVDAIKPPPPDDAGRGQVEIWARRWWSLEDGERSLVRQRLVLALEKLAKARPVHMLPHLIERFGKDKPGVKPTVEALIDFDPGTSQQKADFEAWAAPVRTAWGAYQNLKGRPPLAQNFEEIEAAFAAFRKQIDKAMTTPIDFFRMLKYVRDRRLEGDVWGFDHEIYLEVAAMGLHKALAQWIIKSADASRAFVGDDDAFVFEGIRRGQHGRARQLMRLRLESMKKGPAQIQAESQARRRVIIAGAYQSLTWLDELDTRDLLDVMNLAWTANPLEVVGRWIYAPSGREVFKQRYWINQSVADGFTIVWIDLARDGNRWAFIEIHSLPGCIYRCNGGALTALNEKAFYKALAKNAQALAAFLLAYLEVLGWVADIATAGISGGFRHILWEFAKERIKDKVLEKGMSALGVDNPWLQTAAGFGVNFVHLLRRRPKISGAVEAPSPTPSRGVPDRPDTRPRGADEAAIARTETVDPGGGVAGKTGQTSVAEPPRRKALEDETSRQPEPADWVKALKDQGVIDLAARRRQRAKPEPEPVADPAPAPTSGADEALDARARATGQKPWSEADRVRMDQSKVSDMSQFEARRAQAQQAEVAVGEQPVAMGQAGGGGQARVGHAAPARGGGGSSNASRGIPDRPPVKPAKPLPPPPSMKKLLTAERWPHYDTYGALASDAGKELVKRGLRKSRIPKKKLSQDGYKYQRAVCGEVEYELKIEPGGYWKKRERIVQPDGVAHAKDAPGKLDLVEAKWEADHVTHDNFDFVSQNWRNHGDKVDQMTRYAEAVRQNFDILDKARYCCSSKVVHDAFVILRDQALHPNLRKYVVIELDRRHFPPSARK
ncbi:hypothetical protein LJR225_001249 [Phenylobacterium sp. LjRoot225]|uniref:hypothetical protein n=1 Tax=Phenylobacterium sp. LjRoot225 TaxID=3342285 RepID=UPI003ECCD2EA